MNNYLVVVVLAILASVVTARVLPQNKFEAGLLKVIEKCKHGDVKSLPLPFPSVSPVNLPPMENYINNYMVSVNGAKIKGFEKMSVEKLSTSSSKLKISMEILVPTMTITADQYRLQSPPLLFGYRLVNDEGRLWATINKLKVRIDVQFMADGNNTVIADLNVNYSVGDVQAQLSGSNWIVNRKVNNKISSIITDSNTTGKIRDYIKNMSTRYLRGGAPKHFIKIISSI